MTRIPVLAVTGGDAADYAALFAAHFAGLTRLAVLLGADDPEDIAQEAFVRLHGRRNRLRDPDAALGYLRATVCNLTRNRRRHLGVVRRYARNAAKEPEAVASVEQVALIREDHREVFAAVTRLPRRQREVLVLRYWLDLSEQEIAETLGVSAGTVKSHASRGLAALALALEEST